MNVILGLLRYAFIALLAAYALYVVWMARKDFD